jgi:hypothetical protein
MTKHKEHRLGVSEVNLVKRSLALVQPVDSTALQRSLEEIDQLYGIDEVHFDSYTAKLHFSYDATRLCIDCVEEILTRYDLYPRNDWWTHFKEEHYRFVDQNIKDNAQHEPWSCHQNPPHIRK